MGAACAVAGILCLLYYILLRLLAPTGVASVWLWLFLGGFCLISALILRITGRSHSAAGHSVRVITILLVLVMAGALGCGAAWSMLWYSVHRSEGKPRPGLFH